MLKKFATPFRFEVKPSIILFRLLFSLHVVAVLCVLILPTNQVLKIPVILSIGIGFRITAYRYIFGIEIVRTVVLISAHQCKLELQNDCQLWCRLLPSSFISRKLIILNFREHGTRKVKSIVLFSDSLDQNQFRKLKVQLFLLKRHIWESTIY